jgi:hypothetical protein
LTVDVLSGLVVVATLTARFMGITTYRTGRVKMSKNPKLVDLQYDKIKHKSEKAILFVIDGEDHWIPKSIAEVDEDDCTVTIPYNFAYENEMI